MAREEVAAGEAWLSVAAKAHRRRASRRQPLRACPRRDHVPVPLRVGNDELLVVVAGRPTLRDPDGERELQPGDCVLFPSGPTGAHQLTNHSNEPTRILLVSNFALPRSAVQVDSGKLMIRWGPGPDERRWFRLDDAVDYWEGEAEE